MHRTSPQVYPYVDLRTTARGKDTKRQTARRGDSCTAVLHKKPGAKQEAANLVGADWISYFRMGAFQSTVAVCTYSVEIADYLLLRVKYQERRYQIVRYFR